MAVGFPAKTTYANGDVFSASDINDTNGTLNLASGAQYAAGKNKVINGDFGIWQRGTSFTSPGYTADRWNCNNGLMTSFSATRQTFTPGTAPVAGYEGTYYIDLAGTLSNASTGYNQFENRIEDVRVFAGQTVTLSFWAKGSTSGTINSLLSQNFGTGGTAGELLTTPVNHSITTSWTRFTQTVAIPSISGKTVGTSSYLKVMIVKNMGTSYPTYGTANYTGTLSVWGVQLEAASSATAFQTATGTIQGELAACQRYLPVIGAGNFSNGCFASSTGRSFSFWKFPVTARVAPTGITTPGASNFVVYNSSTTAGNATAVNFDSAGTETADIYFDTTAGSPTLVTGQGGIIKVNTNGYIWFTGCEL